MAAEKRCLSELLNNFFFFPLWIVDLHLPLISTKKKKPNGAEKSAEYAIV